MNISNHVQEIPGCPPSTNAHTAGQAQERELGPSASQIQERLDSNDRAESSGRFSQDLGSLAAQARLKRQALSGLLSNRIAPSLILAHLKRSNASKVSTSESETSHTLDLLMNRFPS